MKIDSLFRVLVLGGAMVSTSGALANDLISELQPTKEDAQLFCTTPEQREIACTVDADGNPVNKPGFTCCWGTSCSDN